MKLVISNEGEFTTAMLKEIEKYNRPILEHFESSIRGKMQEVTKPFRGRKIGTGSIADLNALDSAISDTHLTVEPRNNHIAERFLVNLEGTRGETLFRDSSAEAENWFTYRNIKKPSVIVRRPHEPGLRPALGSMERNFFGRTLSWINSNAQQLVNDGWKDRNY